MRIVRRRTVVLILLCISLGFYLGYKSFVTPDKLKQTWIVPNTQDISKKFMTEEILVNEIHQKQELITLEIQMAEKVTLDDSWGSLEVFKKIQSINFSGTGMYTVDLSSLKAENISIDDNAREITITVAAPQVKSVTISEEKTEYQTPENGLLRFGEIRLTPEENQIILGNVKEKMLKKMSEGEPSSEASKSSEQTIKALVGSIISAKTKEIYNIKVRFQ
jgi:hypothetical protein